VVADQRRQVDDLTRFEIDALIPESYADDLVIGMQAEIQVGGDRNQIRLEPKL